MGDLQAWEFQDFMAEQEQVQIQGARPPALPALPTPGLFQGLQPGQQLQGRPPIITTSHGIIKAGLSVLPTGAVR